MTSGGADRRRRDDGDAASAAPSDPFALLVADVYELAGALRRDGDELAGRAGQTQARWQVLSVVSVGDWTVPTIADRLGITRQAVQRVVDLLIGDGLVTSEQNPRHRRSPHIRLSPAGHDVLSAINAEAERRHEAVTSGLSIADIERTRRVLAKVLAAVRT